MFPYHRAQKKRKRTCLWAALELDLSNLAARFVAQWKNRAAEPKSSSFDVFLTIWREENVALLQSQALSSKNDAGSFAQLLYAACLKLALKNCREDGHSGCDDDDDLLVRAAFGIFSAYAFYESSPLPRGGSAEEGDWKKNLPMGLVHPDNAKFTYRRRYRPKIRIDRSMYATLMHQLRQRCLGETRERRLASELLCVLDLLEFEWCESSGPRGVEAFAARFYVTADFTAAEKGEQQEEATTVALEEQNFAQEARDALTSYHEKLQAVEVTTTSKQAERVQEALKGLRAHCSWSHQIARLQGHEVETLQENRDASAVTIVDVPAGIDHQSIAGSGHVAPSFKLQFPDSISKSVQEGITTAIKDLVERGETLLLPPKETIQPISFESTIAENPVGKHSDFLTLQDEGEVNFDADMSDMSDEEDVHAALKEVGETAFSDQDAGESAAGLHALNLLLKQVKPSRSNIRNADATSVEESSVGRKALISLIRHAGSDGSDDESGASSNYDHSAVDVSRLPKSNKHADQSVGESSVGRHALASLIALTTKPRQDHGETPMRPKEAKTLKRGNKRAKRAESTSDHGSLAESSMGRAALSDLIKRASNGGAESAKRTSRRPATLRRSRKQASKSAPSDELSIAGSSVGRNALSDLIKQANTSYEEDQSMVERRRKVTTVDDASVAASSVGRLTLSDLIKKANESTQDSQALIKRRRKVSSIDDTSVAVSSVGRHALSDLIRKANDSSKDDQVVAKRRRKVAAIDDTERKVAAVDGTSVEASSVGRHALSDLIRKANESTEHDHALMKRKRKVTAIDDSSVAASSIGRHALSELIKKANAFSEDVQGVVKRRRNVAAIDDASVPASSDGRDALSNLKRQATISSRNAHMSMNLRSVAETGDDLSVAASSVGRKALSALIEKAATEDNGWKASKSPKGLGNQKLAVSKQPQSKVLKKSISRKRNAASSPSSRRKAGFRAEEAKQARLDESPPKSGNGKKRLRTKSHVTSAEASLPQTSDLEGSDKDSGKSDSEQISISGSSVGRNALSSLLDQIRK